MSTPLPPDPDKLNDERALWAGKSVEAFIRVTGTEPEDALCDLLCDLMHWCDRNGHSFDATLGAAREHYDCETEADKPSDSEAPPPPPTPPPPPPPPSPAHPFTRPRPMSLFPLPVPDIDDYIKLRSEDGGCTGCIFRDQLVRCSAIPCGPHMARPWPVIYKSKPTP